MNVIAFRFAALSCLSLLISCASFAPRGSESGRFNSPNIILVFIDDMGWADFSCFGNPDAQTPNIDRMALEGIAFEQFYVNSPICSPSRVAISTGQYPQRWGVTSYLAHRAENHKRGIENWLDPAAPMLARSLKDAGYATGHFGKWHMGGQRDVEDAPQITEYGFDESLTNFEGLGPKLLPLTMKPEWTEPGRIWEDAEQLGGPVTWMQRSEITGGFVRAALEFIDRSVEDEKPFYINLWPDDVHTPLFPSVENWAEDKRGLYLAVLTEMDRQLGPLFERIRSDAKLRENTLILICSDNGPEPGAGSAGIFRGCKTNLYEGGIRSPLILWGPGMIDPKSKGMRNVSSIFSAIDLVPSLLQIADVEPPQEITYDGERLGDVLTGRSERSREQPIFFSRPPDRKNFYGYENLPDLAVRAGQWKLLCDYDGTNVQLYDLVADPVESKNLLTSEPAIAKDLSNEVTEWYRKTLNQP